MRLEKIFTYSDVDLKNALVFELMSCGYSDECMYNNKDFLYVEGNAPYLLVAHLDTVHKQTPSIICYSADGNYIMSPQGIGGDDRCGVYIILSLVKNLSFKPHILFTMGEEKGCIGAHAFVDFLCDNVDKIPDVKFIIEYDRKGNNDCVFYQCDNKDFEKFVNGFGFKTSIGSRSDISVIAPELGAAAVNLSSGYYNPHTEHEYVCMYDMHNVINASLNMLNAECEPFKYVAKAVPKYTPPKYCAKRDSQVYSQVRVTVLAANTVYFASYCSGSQFANLENEIAVDANGNYYRFYHSYKDWERVYSVTPKDPHNKPKYDHKKSKMISVYSYSASYT